MIPTSYNRAVKAMQLLKMAADEFPGFAGPDTSVTQKMLDDIHWAFAQLRQKIAAAIDGFNVEDDDE